MALSFAPVLHRLPERFRGDRARRIAGIVLALLVELLLVLVLLTLKPDLIGREDARSTPVFTMEAAEEAAPEPSAEAQPEVETPPSETETPPADTPPAEVPPAPTTPVPPADAPPAPSPPPPYIVLPRETLAQADIRRPSAPPAAAAPAAPARRPTYGPVDRGPAGPPDSEVVGRAPNGEPLYAAAWYREPYPEELRGYLSTASGPGWGLVACRTAPNWRVEDCVSLGESPEGSNIARSVLAAAWQFKVRPPRVGGVSKVGEWVRIRIDYGIERRRR